MVTNMRPPIFVRTLSKEEREALEEGLRSSEAFVLRRCQILLASARGERAPQIAKNLGCGQQTVRDAIHDFNKRGLDALKAISSRPTEVHAAFDEQSARSLCGSCYTALRGNSADRVLFGRSRMPQSELRGGTYERASERGDHPSYAFAAGSALGAGQALDREPRSRVRPKKGARDRLILLAESHPQWAVGFEDETWFSRFERPALRSWSDATKPIRLLEKEAKKDDPEPKALSCYGLYLPELKETWLRFVDGRPVSSITTQFLGWCCHRLKQRGKEALLLIWDNASWHKSHEVRGWITAHNRSVKASGHGVRIVPCLLPTKSPWLNAIEPQWIHSKRKVVEHERLLGAYELAQRVCKVFGCAHEEHLSIPQEVA